jgi:hypothetical protein
MDSQVKTFEEWIVKYRDHDSIRGDLAHDMARDKKWPTGKGIESYRAHVGHHAREALDEAWRAYRAYFRRRTN